MAEAYEHAPCGAPVYAVRHAPVLAYGSACHMFTIQQFLGVLAAVKDGQPAHHTAICGCPQYHIVIALLPWDEPTEQHVECCNM